MRRRGLRRIAGLGAAVATAAALAACSPAGGDERVEIVFLQFKPEAVDFFNDLAAKFEEENPDIRVTVDNVPSAEMAMRIRLVEEDPPDVLTFNANGTFGEFASAGVFHDFAGSPLPEDVNPDYVHRLHGEALNTAMITVGAVVLTLLTNSLVAYVIARQMHRRLFEALFCYYFIAALFIPFPVLMLPAAKQAAILGWTTRPG